MTELSADDLLALAVDALPQVDVAGCVLGMIPGIGWAPLNRMDIFET